MINPHADSSEQWLLHDELFYKYKYDVPVPRFNSNAARAAFRRQFFILPSQPRMHAQPQSALALSCAAAIVRRLVLFDQDCISMELVFPFDPESPRHSTFDVYGPAWCRF